MTTVYIKWLLIFAPAFIFNDVFLCFVRNDGSPQLSMTAMLIGSFSNILLDYIFIFPLHMGLLGAVFATGLSPIISMIFMTPHWLKRKNTFHMIRERFRIDMAKKTLALGIPSLIAQVSAGVVMIVFNMLILKRSLLIFRLWCLVSIRGSRRECSRFSAIFTVEMKEPGFIKCYVMQCGRC